MERQSKPVCRKAFQYLSDSDALTPVFDTRSAFVPDQSIGLRDMLMQFAYIGEEKLSEIVNRGYIGDEDDDDLLGVDVGALDFAEVHDRVVDQMLRQSTQPPLSRRAVVVTDTQPDTPLDPLPDAPPDTPPAGDVE